MLAQDMVEQLRHAPMTDRIQAIEVLLQSLEHNIVPPRSSTIPQHSFTVRTFDLGTDIALDREEMYAERGNL